MGCARRWHGGISGFHRFLSLETHPPHNVRFTFPVFQLSTGDSMLNASLVDIPRPFIDSISSLVESLGVACLALEHPLRANTYALITDQQQRGLGLIRDNPINENTIHNIVGQCSRIPNAHSIVLVSVRTVSPIQCGDVEMLHHCAMVTNNAGLQLLDWVVIGRGGLYCPRSIAGMPDPWPSTSALL